MLTRQQIQRAAGQMGFAADTLEKVWMLLGLLKLVNAHPFLGPRVALKGGTALNLFVFDLPRLSVDIDLNYVGATDRATMMAERPKIDAALEQVVGRAGLTVKRSSFGARGREVASILHLRPGAARHPRSRCQFCAAYAAMARGRA